MGRRIYHKDNFVYKYEFAKQNSEAHRLADEFDIGFHNNNETNPEFVIKKSELDKLKSLIVVKDNYKLFDTIMKEQWEKTDSISFKDYFKLIDIHKIDGQYWFNKMVLALYDYSKKYFEKYPSRRLIRFEDEW
jgi:hypothetical protein